MKKIIVAVLLASCVCTSAPANNPARLPATELFLLVSGDQLQEMSRSSRPSPLLQKFFGLRKKDKKVNAALLAFPFPCGIVGLHRIYLGTAPYVPVVYIATLGGCFGILPFIDFCVLLIDKEIEPYIRNEKVFMWAH